MVDGTLVIKPFDDSDNVNGQVTVDSSNSYPVLRFDVNKSTLRGDYYYITSSQLDKSVIGTVEVKSISDD